MIHHLSTLQLPLILSASTSILGGEEPVSLSYAPAAGSSLATSIEFELNTATSESYWVIQDERIEADFLQEKFVSAQFEFVDELAEVAGGRPTEFTRTFTQLEAEREDEYSGENAGEGGTLANEYSSDLLDEVIAYSWDAEEEEYESDLPESRNEDLLEMVWDGSAYDLTFACILPDGEVEVGDSWEVDAFVFGMLLVDPYLEFGLVGDEGNAVRGPRPMRRGVFGEVDHDRAAWLSGTIEASLSELREVEGRSCAVIELELELEGDFPSEFEDEESGAVVHNTERHEFSLEGEALWDVAGGHLRELELEGSEEKEEGYVVDHPDDDFDNASVDVLSGSVVLSIQCELE